jgi:hypothetical protein
MRTFSCRVWCWVLCVSALGAGCGGGGPAAGASPTGGTAEGLWRGTTGNGLDLRILVRRSGSYTAYYTAPATPDTAGIVQGTGRSVDGAFVTEPSLGTTRLSGRYVQKTTFDGEFIPATFATRYDATYEDVPLQSTIVGSYAGGSLTLTIAVDGSLTGATAGPFGCAFAGFAVPATDGGKVYTLRITSPSACTGIRYDGTGFYDGPTQRLFGSLSGSGANLVLAMARQ